MTETPARMGAATLPAATRTSARAAAGARIRALAALGALAVVCVGLAVPIAAPGSTVVLAAAERSPDWLLGPWRAFGASGADGELAGPLYFLGLWLALVAYVAVLACSRAIGARLALGAVAGLHALFMLAPPLLSQDVFSYISYARLDVLHGLDPYTHSPDAVPTDAAFPFAGSKHATSVYGPLFTIATWPLAELSVPVAFWTLKVGVALASFGVVALTWWCARLLGRDPVFCALAVGLNPLVLVHVVGGAHNDALVMLLTLGAVAAVLSARSGAAAGALAATATGVKASAGLVFPFLLAGAHRRWSALVGAAVTGGAALAVALVAFGADAFDALAQVGSNQERTTRWSAPQRVADAVAGVLDASPDSLVDVTRALFAVAFVVLVVVLLRGAWQDPRPSRWVAAAGWATLGLLIASAWLVPWYAIWLLPLAALSGSRALMGGTLALTAYMLVIAVPL